MDKEQIKVYTPASSLANPLILLRNIFGDLIAGNELALRLAVRDISSQYRQTFLGPAWAFILPLANTFIWVLLNSSGVISVSTSPLPYPLYVFSGTILWAIFMEALNAPLQQVGAARGMLTKLNFPRESLIMSGIYQVLFNSVIKLILLIGVFLYMGFSPGFNLLLVPVAIFSLILAGTTLGLFVTPVGILYNDIGRGLPLLMQLVMYITPVVFPLPKSGWAHTFYYLNPLSPLIYTARNWLSGYPTDCLTYYVIINCVSAVILLGLLVVYRLAMPILIERMSS